jgi:hypothetical protein
MSVYNSAIEYRVYTAAPITLLASAVERLGTLHWHQRLVFPALVETRRLRCVPRSLPPEQLLVELSDVLALSFPMAAQHKPANIRICVHGWRAAVGNDLCGKLIRSSIAV